MVAPLREGFREVGRGPIIPKLWTDRPDVGMPVVRGAGGGCY